MTQLSIFDRPSPFKLLFEDLAKECGDPDQLRYYQRAAYESVAADLGEVHATMVVMATGSGKTRLFRTVVKYWPGRVLVLAQRDELVNQAVAELEGIGERVDIEKAEQVSHPSTRIVVGSLQSMNKKRLDRLGADRFTLIVIDECHHSIAPSYQRVFDFFPLAKRFGVTATPDRGDRRALGSVFDRVSYVFDIEDGIASGYLVPIRGQRIILKGVDLDTMKKRGGDLPAEALEEVMAEHIDSIVQETIRLEPRRTAICFFPGRRSAELAAERFNYYKPGSAAYVDGFTDPDIRAGIMAAFKQGRIRYLCNCAVATEGFDAPNADMVVLARPTLSRALYAQMIGRGGRVAPGVVDHMNGEGWAKERREAIAKSYKPDMMILDFVGNSQKHDLVTAVDVLGGKYTEAEVKDAKKRIRSGGDVLASLAEARERLKALAQRAKVEVKSEVVSFDPFSVLGLSIQDGDRFANVGQFGARRAHPGQLAQLAVWGLKQTDIEGLSFRGAKRLIDKCLARKAAGLCTYKQLSTLQRFGVTDLNLTFDRATAALDYIASKGWGKKATINPKALDDIINYRRVSGED